MTGKEKADLKLNCFYGAIAGMGVNSLQKKGKKRPTTDEILAEAKKISEWVSDVKGDDK